MEESPKSNFWSSGMVQLNLAILFISTSGVLGRYIEQPVPVTIGLRALLAAIILYGFSKWRGLSLQLKSSDRWLIWGAGVLFGVHWMTYFYALQLSSVAIGMLSLFTFPILTAILEPLVFRSSIQLSHIGMGLVVLIGLYFLAPEGESTGNEWQAIGFGLISALVYSIRNIIMKSKTNQYHGSVLMTHQLVVMSLMLTPAFWLLDTSQTYTYLPFVFLLALITTALGHTLFLFSFRHFSVATASIISCLQPVYGILLGMLFLHEYPTNRTVIGGLLILSTVIIESWLSAKRTNTQD